MRRRAIIFVALALASCSDQVPPPDCHVAEAVVGSDAFVKVRGQSLMLDDQPVRLVGANAWQLLRNLRRGRGDRVQEVLDSAVAHGLSVLRVWAFNVDPESGWRIHHGPGSYDEEGLVALDQLVTMAGTRGLRLILTLGNNWPDFGSIDIYGSWEGATRRADALADDRVAQHLASYGTMLAHRRNTVTGVAYNEDPTIVGWDVVNELRCSTDECSPQQTADFAHRVVSAMRPHIPRQLLGLGDEGFVGEEGSDIRIDTGADWVSVHVWPHHWGSLAGPEGNHAAPVAVLGDAGRAWITQGAAVATVMNRPLVVGEMGVPAAMGNDVARAAVLGDWMHGGLDAGADMVAVWNLGDRRMDDADGYTWIPGTNEALDTVICDVANRANHPR